MLMTKEHYDLIAQFERQYKGIRADKEEKSWWPKGHIYQDGRVNEMFLAFRNGYALGKAVELARAADAGGKEGNP